MNRLDRFIPLDTEEQTERFETPFRASSKKSSSDPNPISSAWKAERQREHLARVVAPLSAILRFPPRQAPSRSLLPSLPPEKMAAKTSTLLGLFPQIVQDRDGRCMRVTPVSKFGTQYAALLGDEIEVVELKSGQVKFINCPNPETRPTALAFSPNQKKIFIGYSNGLIESCDLRDLFDPLKKPEDIQANGIQFDKTPIESLHIIGDNLIAGKSNGEFFRINLKDPDNSITTSEADLQNDRVVTIASSQDQRWIACGGSTNRVVFYTKSFEKKHLILTDSTPCKIVFSPFDSNHVAIPSVRHNRRTIDIYDLNKEIPALLASIPLNVTQINGLDWSRENLLTWVKMGGSIGRVKIDLTRPEGERVSLADEYRFSQTPFLDAEILGDGRIYTISETGQLCLWS